MPSEVRVHSHTGGFTIITNEIFSDKTLSLKAKGLLCTVLSLPADWDYSIRGLLKIINPSNKGKTCPLQGQGRDGLYATLKELETHGYLVRERARSNDGLLGKTLYHFYDISQLSQHTAPNQSKKQNEVQGPPSLQPYTELPYLDKPDMVNPTQVSTKENKVLKQSIINRDSKHVDNENQDAEKLAGDSSSKSFEKLCALSLKRVAPSTLSAVRQMYRKRLEEGYSCEQIEQAYRRYVTRFKESNDNIRYAKQLINWLTQSDGLTWDTGIPEKKRQSNQTLDDRSEFEYQTKEALKQIDPVYKQMSEDFMALIQKALHTRNDERKLVTEKVREMSGSLEAYLSEHKPQAVDFLKQGGVVVRSDNEP